MRSAASHAVCPPTAAQRGGVLILMILSVLVLGAATLVLQAAQQTRRPLAEQRTTEQRMQRIEQAIYAHWLKNQCNQLPPSPSGPAPEVPWVALGLQADDRLDAWGRLITYRQAATGLTVSGVAARWALVSHGPSGLGAWLPSGVQKLPLPVATNVDERANTNATAPFALVNKPANAPDGVDPATDPAHFDDVVLSGVLPTCIPQEETPGNVVGDVLGLPIAESIKVNGRADNQNITYDGGISLGTIQITSTGGGGIITDASANARAIGVCRTGCGSGLQQAAERALGGMESLTFKLTDADKTAQSFAMGLLWVNPDTVTVSIEFKHDGLNVSYVTQLVNVDNVVPPSPQLTSQHPSPPVVFDEVIIRPFGTSLFFISSFRFCASTTTCN